MGVSVLIWRAGYGYANHRQSITIDMTFFASSVPCGLVMFFLTKQFTTVHFCRALFIAPHL